MTEYISRCFLMVNGAEIADFKTVKEGERELRVAVPLMHKTGFASKTERLTVMVDYVPPQGTKVNWDTVENGTLVIEHEDGYRVLYTGVCTLKVGEAAIDGDKEQVIPITLGAETRRVE